MKYYDKPDYVIKKALIMAVAKEYAKSESPSLMYFMQDFLYFNGVCYSLPVHLSDKDLLEQAAKYNEVNSPEVLNMNEALE